MTGRTVTTYNNGRHRSAAEPCDLATSKTTEPVMGKRKKSEDRESLKNDNESS